MNLRQLSQYLNLSQTTISRALNGYPEVSESTRARVIAAAHAQGYRPNPSAKRLATGRNMAIAHVIPITEHHEMANPIFADFILGAGQVYAEHGYEMSLSIVAADDETKTYAKLVERQTVDGVIVHAPQESDYRIGLLQNLELPFVVHGRTKEIETPYCWVDVNNRRAFQRATELLLDFGHRHFALINGQESMEFARRRREGVEKALAARGLPAQNCMMFSDEMTEGFGYRAMTHALQSANPPSAYLISSIIAAMGARRAVMEQGLVLGRDVSIITHDDDLNYFQNGAEEPDFTTVYAPVRAHGKAAAEMLMRRIAAPRAPVETYLIEAQLRIGHSTGPARQRTR